MLVHVKTDFEKRFSSLTKGSTTQPIIGGPRHVDYPYTWGRKLTIWAGYATTEGNNRYGRSTPEIAHVA